MPQNWLKCLPVLHCTVVMGKLSVHGCNPMFFRFPDTQKIPATGGHMLKKLMRDNGNPFIKLPAKCELELDGKRWLHHLRWTKISAQGKEWERRASDGEQLPVGMTSPKPGWFWIAAQTFSPDESQRAAYRKMYQDIREKRNELLKASAIVD
jgi:hypothetical protein